MVPLAADCGPDLTFEKLRYIMPGSLNMPLMSDRSNLRKADVSIKGGDKKGGKKDKKDKDKDKETSGSRTPATMSNAGGVRVSKERVTVNINK